ncbi:family 43 glycosylhydrolase [Phenylobacterium montanum]|uniref:Family 43 glycosylhydrolase n=1 Tax=Phenylobacterium montanum TaxID=2823693 RepID=A0A975G1M8_9CAUL|nr:family 43 glycosylhydrolase [Caulobacter sp. S6]QUD89230.1 family 43 glycosylhydrolase [Caulobacter sp. S6]
MTLDRRILFKAALAGAAGSAVAGGAVAAPACATTAPTPRWGMGPEGQRIADLGDGTYLNPIVAGDHPDPTILKDGADYYMTFTSFDSSPGLVIWRSGDLVNWTPVGPALTKPLGNVFAVDLVKHKGRYFIYIPADVEGRGFALYVIWADDIRGPWSDPIDLKITGCIDPGHIVGEDGKRYLFVNGVRRVRLTDDGLAADGALEPAYQAWRYPDDWIVEDFAPEGPKLMRRGEWFYLINAVGGTAGPPTGHMVIAARSRSVHGPWEYCPYNPVVRTRSVSEPWWSRGHATLVEGPAGDWWMVYHGYENGFRTLGRQTLLEPIEWTDDGWFRAKGGDLSAPIAKPRGGRAGPSGHPLSDDFSADRFGLQWSFHQPGADERTRAVYEPGGLRLKGRGTSPADSSPLTCIVGDRAYDAEISIDLIGEAEGGLLLFYNHKAFLGLGFGQAGLKTFLSAEEQPWMRMPLGATTLRLKVTNDANIVTWRYSRDEGKTWTRHDIRSEVSGFNHNTFGGFLSLTVGIYAAGGGEVRLRDFKYRALATSAA